jgi:hypothetical protein
VVLRGAVVVVVVGVVGVVRLGAVVRVVVGFVVFGFVGPPNDPPPTVEPVESCWANADAKERESIEIIPIRRRDERDVGITFLLLNDFSSTLMFLFYLRMSS